MLGYTYWCKYFLVFVLFGINVVTCGGKSVLSLLYSESTTNSEAEANALLMTSFITA